MKKRLVALLAAVMVCAAPYAVHAEAVDLEARVAALEARVAALEALLGGSVEESPLEEEMPAATEAITLAAGTYIVGEDLPAGKYKITCADGTSEVKIYNDYETRKRSEYGYFEDYDLCTQSYLDYLSSIMGEAYLQTLAAIYTLEANNVRLEAPNCIFIDGSSLVFTPVG